MDNSGPSSDLGPVAGPSSQAGPATSQPISGNGQLSRNGSVARRQLRARPSDTTAPSPVSKRARSDTNGQLRPPTEKELAYINSSISEEGLAARRDGVIKGKEAELKQVVDRHDTAVREKFHLERFTSIFEGWDPEVCLCAFRLRMKLTVLGC